MRPRHGFAGDLHYSAHKLPTPARVLRLTVFKVSLAFLEGKLTAMDSGIQYVHPCPEKKKQKKKTIEMCKVTSAAAPCFLNYIFSFSDDKPFVFLSCVRLLPSLSLQCFSPSVDKISLPPENNMDPVLPNPTPPHPTLLV